MKACPRRSSGWRPNVTVNGSVGKQRLETDGVFGAGTQNTTPVTGAVTVTQFLYRGGRTVAGTEQAEANVLSERAQLISVEQAVLLNAVTAYMNVWQDQSILDLNKNNEQVLQRQLEASQDRFEVGEVTRTDVAQSESRLAGAQAGVIEAEGNLQSSRAIFQEFVGVYPGTLSEPPDYTDLPTVEEAVVDLSIANNPNVVSAQFAEKAAEVGVRIALGSLLPEVSLQGTAAYSRETALEESDSKQLQVLAQVSIPIYQQGLVSSQVRQSKQVASQARLVVDETRRDTEQQAVSAWEDLVTARARIKSFESEVNASRIALDGVRQENAVGARTVLDVLDAEQEFLDAQVDLVTAKRDNLVAAYTVLSAMGQLTARTLALPVDIYDPDSRLRGCA